MISSGFKVFERDRILGQMDYTVHTNTDERQSKSTEDNLADRCFMEINFSKSK